ncbi:DEAD/DEAH box helicase [Candidatus Woesearchaeota archaeon]|nr:DEAD/DEAH box helicase [Candidatus Woesearchaeota archaeon]
MEGFRELGIIEPVLKAIEEEKFEHPSEVQEKSIPVVLSGKDVIAGSATGSGKTLAFGCGIIQRCERGRGLQALVLAPTRELAEQVSRAMRNFSKYKRLEIIAVYGGVGIEPQIRNIRNADVVVGTPGRLLDHLERKTIDFRNLRIVVLDEADKMFEMGFIEDVERILKSCPAQRQTLLFSATISRDVVHVAQKHMKSPVEVAVEGNVDPQKLQQCYYEVPDNLKFSLLVHLLKNEKSKLVMVFCNTKRNTDFVARNLKHAGINALAIHGGLSQAKRNRTLGEFHAQNIQVLVCTDVASRGLDIPGISHVYNYDIPKESRQYIHRIGRTARAGKEGKAVNILCSRDYDNFSRVLRDNAVEIPKEKTPYVERVVIAFTGRTPSPSGARTRFPSRAVPRHGYRRFNW